MTTKTLYEAIQDAWKATAEATGDKPWEVPPHLQVEENAARQLDKQLGELLQEPIQQYQDGLIASTELVDKLFILAHTTMVEV